MKCRTVNVKTSECPCNNNTWHNGTTRIQTLRRVGPNKHFMLSVIFMTEVIEGVINTMERSTTINQEMVDLLGLIDRKPNRWGEIMARITINNEEMDYPCRIKYDQTIAIVIGQDLLEKVGFALEIGGCRVNEYSPIFKHPREIRTIPIIYETAFLPPYRTNPMLEAVHQHTTERLRNQIEWDTIPTPDELSLAIEKMILSD